MNGIGRPADINRGDACEEEKAVSGPLAVNDEPLGPFFLGHGNAVLVGIRKKRYVIGRGDLISVSTCNDKSERYKRRGGSHFPDFPLFRMHFELQFSRGSTGVQAGSNPELLGS